MLCKLKVGSEQYCFVQQFSRCQLVPSLNRAVPVDKSLIILLPQQVLDRPVDQRAINKIHHYLAPEIVCLFVLNVTVIW